MAAPGAPAIVAEHLRKEFAGLVAVADFTLSVAPGEIVGLVGPDGAGKTATMRLLAGAMPPTAGTALLAGYDVVRQPERVKERIGYMPQRFSLYGDLTVMENLRFFAEIYCVPRDQQQRRASQLLEFARLTPFTGRLAQHLSGGMKQKLALACTLMHTPQVLLLDEPTTGVDPVSRREFWQILVRLLSEGVTVLASTPYMDEAERCSRVALMAQGRVLSVDTPAGMKARLPGGLVRLVASPQRAARQVLAGLDYVRSVEVFGNRLHVAVADPAHDEPRLQADLAAAGIRVSEHRAVPATLEDVFVQALQRPEPAHG